MAINQKVRQILPFEADGSSRKSEKQTANFIFHFSQYLLRVVIADKVSQLS